MRTCVVDVKVRRFSSCRLILFGRFEYWAGI